MLLVINCSTFWNDEHNEVKTTFLPIQNVKDITNTFGKDDKKLNDALDMHNLSAWGFNKVQTIEHLDYFIDKYENWIKNQTELNKQEQESNKIIGSKIIKKQEKNLQRLKDNILLLSDDDTFRAFQIANTAMYLQLIISNDSDFGKKRKKNFQKHLTDNLDSLDFFKTYHNKALKRLNFVPAYRPFQLAFLLL